MTTRAAPGLLGAVAMTWGVAGFALLLITGLVRLFAVFLESLSYDWELIHGVVFVINIGLMAWFEGYRGFQRSYSPRFAERAHALLHSTTPAKTLLAPLVCMGFVYAPTRRVVATWILTAGIIVVVVVYRLLPQPWRGILDAGVFVGLGWGLIATIVAVLRLDKET
ncbi:MAG: hypothetical protein AAF654_05865 [Myxococcota bacterium]